MPQRTRCSKRPSLGAHLMRHDWSPDSPVPRTHAGISYSAMRQHRPQAPPPPCVTFRRVVVSFTGPWTLTRSCLRILRRVAAVCRPLRPVLPLVSLPRSWSPEFAPLPTPPPPPHCLGDAPVLWGRWAVHDCTSRTPAVTATGRRAPLTPGAPQRRGQCRPLPGPCSRTEPWATPLRRPLGRLVPYSAHCARPGPGGGAGGHGTAAPGPGRRGARGPRRRRVTAIQRTVMRHNKRATRSGARRVASPCPPPQAPVLGPRPLPLRIRAPGKGQHTETSPPPR